MNGVPGSTPRDFYRWAWLLLATLALLAYAHATRYVPQVANDSGLVAVWDRWRHRMCWMGVVEGSGDPLEALRAARAHESPGRADCFYVPREAGVTTPISGVH